MSLTEIATTISVLLAPGVVIVGAIRATSEYVVRGRQQRIDKLEQYWARFWTSEKAHNWVHLLSYDLEELARIEVHHRLELLGLLEEVSTSLKAGTLRREDVFNFFGWITNSIRQCSNFWNGIDKVPEHWIRYRYLCLVLSSEARRNQRLAKSLQKRISHHPERPLQTFPDMNPDRTQKGVTR